MCKVMAKLHMNVGSSILHNCKIVVQTHTFATCQLTTAKIDSFEVEKKCDSKSIPSFLPLLVSVYTLSFLHIFLIPSFWVGLIFHWWYADDAFWVGWVHSKSEIEYVLLLKMMAVFYIDERGEATMRMKWTHAIKKLYRKFSLTLIQHHAINFYSGGSSSYAMPSEW